MKAAGSLIITVTCILLGQYLARGLTMRVKQLEAVCVMLSTVRTSLQYRCCPVDDLINELEVRQELKILSFIAPCAESCKRSTPFPQAWRCALENRSNVAFLSESDIERLISFGQALGTTDIDGQLAVCDMYAAVMSESLASARSAMKKYSKVFPALGALLGFAVAVIAA